MESPYRKNLDYGTKEESGEHKDTYDKDVKKDVSQEEFGADIAKDHLKIDKHYYEDEMKKESGMEVYSIIDDMDSCPHCRSHGEKIEPFHSKNFTPFKENENYYGYMTAYTFGENHAIVVTVLAPTNDDTYEVGLWTGQQEIPSMELKQRVFGDRASEDDNIIKGVVPEEIEQILERASSIITNKSMKKESGTVNDYVKVGDYVQTPQGNGVVTEHYERDVFEDNWREHGLDIALIKVKLDNGVEEDFKPEELIKLNMKKESIDQSTRYDQYKVVSVSSNTNSFGLYGMILMNKKGEAYQVGANSMYVPKKGNILNVPINNEGKPKWASMGYEIPESKGIAPQEVIKEVWGMKKEAESFFDNGEFGYIEYPEENKLEQNSSVSGYELDCPFCNMSFEADVNDVGLEPFIVDCPNCGKEVGSEYGVPLRNVAKKVISTNLKTGEAEELVLDDGLGNVMDAISEEPEGELEVIEEVPEPAMEAIDPNQSDNTIKSQLLTCLTARYPNALTYQNIFNCAEQTGLTGALDKYDLVGILNYVAVEVGLPKIDFSPYFATEDAMIDEKADIEGIENQISWENEGENTFENFKDNLDNKADSLFSIDRILDERLKMMNIDIDPIIKESFNLAKKAVKDVAKRTVISGYELSDLKIDKISYSGKVVTGNLSFRARMRSLDPKNHRSERTIEIPIIIQSSKILNPKSFNYNGQSYPLQTYYLSDILDR